MAAFSITAEELMAQTIAAVKAKGIELDQPPLADEDAALIGKYLWPMMEIDPNNLPTSQAETEKKLGQIKDMPKDEFVSILEMIKKMTSPAAEEMMAQIIAAVKAKGIELGQPLSDEDAPGFVAAMTSLPLGCCVPPESQAGIDEMLDLRDMPKEAFDTFKMMASKGAGKGDNRQRKAFSITAEELVDQTVAAFRARAAELGQPLSDEDAASLSSSMGQASVDLPESQAEVDGKLGQIKEMPKEALDQTIEMIKMMAVKGAGKGE